MTGRLFFSLLLAAFMLLASPASSQAADSVFLIDGENAGSADTYMYEGRYYVSAAQSARILGGKMDLLPASGRVVITAKRAKLFFSETSDSVSINGIKKSYSRPLIIRAGTPFVLAACLADEDLHKAYGRKIAFSHENSRPVMAKNDGSNDSSEKQSAAPVEAQPKTSQNLAQHSNTPIAAQPKLPQTNFPQGKSLQSSLVAATLSNSEPVAHITEARCGKHSGKTRLVLNITSQRPWSQKRLKESFILSVPGAVSDINSSIESCGNEISAVNFIRSDLRTEIILALPASAGHIECFNLSSPDRIVIDAYELQPGEKIACSDEIYSRENKSSETGNSAGKNKIPSAIAIVPQASFIEESLDEPESDEEDISVYPVLRPLSSGGSAIVKENASQASQTGQYPASALNAQDAFVPPESSNLKLTANAKNKNTESAKPEIKKNSYASNVSKKKYLVAKNKKGKTIRKAAVPNNKETVMSSSVMAGLKASGLNYLPKEEPKKKKNQEPSSTVSYINRRQNAKEASQPALQAGKRIVVIDPAHGGKDPGGPRKFGLTEKHFALLLAKEIYKMFEGNEHFQAVLTRNSDVFMPLKERSRIANEIKADIFISLHANASSRSSSAKGFEVYSLSENISDSAASETLARENAVMELESDSERPSAEAVISGKDGFNIREESSRLSNLISSELARGTSFKNNGSKKADFIMLRLPDMPAVCVFAGYMTNSEDKQKIDDRQMRKRIARSIYNGIMAYGEMKGWTK